jgi:hypothetical protein
MKELSERIATSARHLSLIDEICEKLDPAYRSVKDDLRKLPGYSAVARELYGREKVRQMVLGDLLTYIVAARGYWSARGQQGFEDYLRVILHMVNLILIQETILSSRPGQRKKFLTRLAKENLPNFFSDDAEKHKYQELIETKDQVRPGHALYKTMDSVLPKSAGIAIELLVFVYLLRRSLGYIVPLLFTQRIFRGPESFAPPDYLILRPGGQVIGVEVGGGLGQYGSPSRGKVHQVNRFVQDTSIPVVTVLMPHMQYRCPICNEWPVFCPEVIERVATSWDGGVDHISCPTCPRFDGGDCPFILFKGKTAVRENDRHYHYQHVKANDYVQSRALRTKADQDRKLVSYFPFVEGLERIPRMAD